MEPHKSISLQLLIFSIYVFIENMKKLNKLFGDKEALVVAHLPNTNGS
jgi:hypothetical protein